VKKFENFAAHFLRNDFAVLNLKRVHINDRAVLTYVTEAQVVRPKLNGWLLFVQTPVVALQNRAVGLLHASRKIGKRCSRIRSFRSGHHAEP
jgi:hypothetical protein